MLLTQLIQNSVCFWSYKSIQLACFEFFLVKETYTRFMTHLWYFVPGMQDCFRKDIYISQPRCWGKWELIFPKASGQIKFLLLVPLTGNFGRESKRIFFQLQVFFNNGKERKTSLKQKHLCSWNAAWCIKLRDVFICSAYFCLWLLLQGNVTLEGSVQGNLALGLKTISHFYVETWQKSK